MSSNLAVARFGNYKQKKKKGSTAESAWRGQTQFDASRRGKKELKASRDKNASYEPQWVGAKKRLLCDPGPELRLGGRDNRRAKIINGTGIFLNMYMCVYINIFPGAYLFILNCCFLSILSFPSFSFDFLSSVIVPGYLGCWHAHAVPVASTTTCIDEMALAGLIP